MFSVGLSGGGDSNPQIKCDIIQLITLFPTATFVIPKDEFRKRFSCIPPGADPSNYQRVFIKDNNTMDPITKKNTSIILPTHQIFNNPNISITPSSPLVKQPAITFSSRPPLNVPPVSILPVSTTREPDKSSPNIKETQKNSKRTASYQISDRIIKKPRLSITKPTKPRKDYKPIISNQVVNHQNIKKNDTAVSSINVATCIPSTSNAVIRSSQEVARVQSSKEELQLSKPESNCKEDSSHLNVNKNENGILMKYFCITDNQCKFDGIGDKSGFTNSNQEMIRIQTKNEIYEITRSKMMDEVLFAVGMAMKKTVTKEELETLKQNSNVLQSPKLDWSSDTKNIATNSKTSPTNHNNISNSKSQSKVSINKSRRHTINLHQPSKQTVKISNITKQQSASSTVSSKMQSSTTKQTDIRRLVTNDQSNNTSLKHMATTKHIQTSNKQKLDSKQLPTSSKTPISTLPTPKKVVSLCNVKPTVTYQSSVKDVTKCIKCKVVSEDEVCAACRMASHLKNVTVTRIETPSTSAVIAPDNPIITPIKSIDVPSSSTNSVSPHDSSVLILSSDEEDDNLEPIITKVETTEALKKHVDKLTLNPKLLEDRLWQKDLSVKDYFKFEECHSVHIGSFETIPAACGDMLVCLHGIRMGIRNLASEPVTIDLQMDNVVKILGSYGEKPLIIIYTDHVAAVGIQYLLNMNEDNKNYFYDPLSKDSILNKIVWYFNLKRNELSQLEKLLLKLPKNKYGPLTVNQANKILGLNKKADEEAKKCDREEREIADSMVVLLEDKLSERIHKIKVLDYKMLSSGEFLNDILMEYYMDYVYTHELSDEDRKRSCIFSTYFYTALSKSINLADYRPSLSPSKIRHERVKKWTKHVDIFKKDFIFIPINENAHWYLAVICYPYLSGKINMKDGTPVNTPDDNIGRYQLPPYESTNPDRSEADPNVEDLWLFDPCSTQSYVEKRGVNYETDVANYLKNRHTLVKRPCILIFDSLSGGLCRARVTATLRDWLEQEYIAKYNDETKNFSPNIFKASLVKVPQQPNFYDCGLFALYFFKLFFDKPIIDYTFPISYLENWFHPDEVSKNNIKRRELNNLILARMKERGSVLPVRFKLPILDLTTIKTHNTSQYSSNLHRITHLSDVSNSINLSNRQNSSNRHNLNPPHNSPKPSTSQNQPKHPNPSPKVQHYININQIGHQNNHHYRNNDNEDSVDSIDEDVNRQYNQNDMYDEGEQPDEEEINRQYDEDDEDDEDDMMYNEGEQRYLLNQAEYLGEMGRNIEDENDGEDLEHDYVNEPPFNEFHRNMLHANNGNVPYGNDLRAGPGNHRGVAHPNENFQLLRPNNRDVYNNDDEYHDIVDEDEDEEEEVEDEDDDDDDDDDDDEGDEIHQFHHHNPNHNSDDEDEDYYQHAPNPIINLHRHDNHFNHNRRLN